MGLIVPKYIEINQYAYWQTFILYSGYIGIFHFGLLDGIVLRYSQYDYDKLDKPLLRSQLVWLLVFTSGAASLCCISSLFISDCSLQIVFFLVGLNTIIQNVLYYTSFVYQVTNEISKYVTIIIFERVTHVIMVLLLLIIRVDDFYWFCIMQMLGACFGIFLGILKSKDIFFGPINTFKESVIELKLNVSSGVKLLAANWSAMFLIAGAKTFIQWHWDLITFGYISFSFSLTSLFLSFITAVSVVLFPALKRTSTEKLNILYPKLRMKMTVLLLAMLPFYYLIEYLLPLWLPKYEPSLKYFGMVLPIVVFTSRLTLLTNNYLKVFRQENAMFKINVSTLMLAIICYIPCVFIFDSLEMIIYCAVFAIILRAIRSESKLSEVISYKFSKEIIVELLLCVIFIISLQFEKRVVGASIYIASMTLYIITMMLLPEKRCLLLR